MDLGIDDGETLGLVGESGSGKSTLAKAMLGIHAPDDRRRGQLDDEAIAGKSGAPGGGQAAVQMVFQNPDSAAQPELDRAPDPEALRRQAHRVKGKKADDRVAELADALRLSPATSTSSRASSPAA